MGQIQCVVCGFNFEKHYGEIGCDFIEMHHENPLSILHRPRLVTPAHLKPVCANCHRMIHRQRPFLPTRNLKLAITKARSNTYKASVVNREKKSTTKK
jgi:predicted HNH restriction endonuclease